MFTVSFLLDAILLGFLFSLIFSFSGVKIFDFSCLVIFCFLGSRRSEHNLGDDYDGMWAVNLG